MLFYLYIFGAVLTMTGLTLYDKIDQRINPTRNDESSPTNADIFGLTLVLSAFWPVMLFIVLFVVVGVGVYKSWNYLFDTAVDKLFSLLKTIKKDDE